MKWLIEEGESDWDTYKKVENALLRLTGEIAKWWAERDDSP